MHEGFLNVNYKCEQRFLSVYRMPFADRCVSNNKSLARNPQCVAVTWHNEKKSNVWVFQQVLKAIDAVVAQPIWNDDRLIIVDFHKPSRVTFRGDINQTFGRFGCDNYKWRQFNEFPCRIIKSISYLEESVGKPLGWQELS